tara:strand:- start:1163 stop:1408 length:246 start_codon:yes stop_codon:yes gene_type:complete
MKLIELLEEAKDLINTSSDHGHSHYALVNIKGNGKTTSTDKGPNHIHRIKDWKVLSSGDGHAHTVKKPKKFKELEKHSYDT